MQQSHPFSCIILFPLLLEAKIITNEIVLITQPPLARLNVLVEDEFTSVLSVLQRAAHV